MRIIVTYHLLRPFLRVVEQLAQAERDGILADLVVDSSLAAADMVADSVDHTAAVDLDNVRPVAEADIAAGADTVFGAEALDVLENPTDGK